MSVGSGRSEPTILPAPGGLQRPGPVLHPPALPCAEGTQPAPSNEEVVAAVVGPRLEQLDGTFLATLDGYIAGAQDKGATDVAGARAPPGCRAGRRWRGGRLQIGACMHAAKQPQQLEAVCVPSRDSFSPPRRSVLLAD